MIQELKLREPNALHLILSSFDFVRSFFGWWYGDAPLSLLSLLKRVLIVLNDYTSFTLILKGYFRPWKNDYNIAGWLMGIVIKTLYLPIIATLFLFTVAMFILLLFAQLAIMPVIIGLIIINPFLRP